MTKRHWRESIKALGSNIDPDQDEKVKRSKIGIHFSKQPQSLQFYWRLWDYSIQNKFTWFNALQQAPIQCRPHQDLDNRVEKLMKLIQHKSQSKKGGGAPIFDLELIEHIHDFHVKYQTLHSLYEHLKGHVPTDVHEKVDKHNFSSSSSSSSSSSLISLVCFRQKPDSTTYQWVQEFEELKINCSRLNECLAAREKKLCTQKREIEDLSMEVKELGEQNDGLRELILELEMTSKQKEEKLSDFLRKSDEKEVDILTKSEDLVEKADDLQLEVDALWSEKEIVYQEGEIVHILSPNKSKSKMSAFLFQLELLKEKFESKNVDLQKILKEKGGLERKVIALENQMQSLISGGSRMGIEKEGLYVRVSELEELLRGRNRDVFVLQAEFERLKNDSFTKNKALQEELHKREQYYQNIVTDKEEVISKLIEEKTYIKDKFYEFKMKRIEETTEKLQQKVNRSLGTANLANDIMSSLNSVEMKDMSMFSDSLVLAKKYEENNNEVMNEMKGNLELLCDEIGIKEAEILRLKEIIWKLENDMRGLGEEKREAIRQLCVWVDYHRNKNKNLKKIISNLLAYRSRRAI